MDYVRRFLFEDLDIRGAIVVLGHSWQEMHAGRDDPPAVNALLGELAATAALIAGNLKSPGRLTLQMQGHGPLALLLIDCDEQLRLRGTARLTSNAVAEKVGAGGTAAPSGIQSLLADGQLLLTLQSTHGQPYQSIVPLVGDHLAAVFEHYLEQSEQQPAHLFLTANDQMAAGLFLQKLPNADQRDTDGWNRIGHLAATLKPDEFGKPVAEMLIQLFPEENIRLFDPRPVRYHCPRDEEKVLGMLRGLGRNEVEASLAELGELVIEDDICRHTYRYGKEILPQLFAE
jgi:molecular chaperone Hsp33